MKDRSIVLNILITILFILLTIAGIISYKSIDWDVLKKIEQQNLVLPTPILKPSISSESVTTSSSSQK
ncbi:hypothetical protein SDC9_127165 [bioreactor metagenome]|uniref:Uncharacterized protein n=1 Tax=bioreactor metagenome TaxID=1076179 RepID=A0A645CTA0_9ZZZZ